MTATAKIEFITSKRAVVSINYADGSFGFFTVEGHDLYERGYTQADIACTSRGFRLERYSRV
jgi:hypothetical protein